MKVLTVDRREDMSPNGYMRLLMEQDGDIVVWIAEGEDDGSPCRTFAQVQFTAPWGGGGRSPKTHAALRELMRAMAEDNRDGNQSARQEFSGEEILEQ